MARSIPGISASRHGVFCVWAEESADLNNGAFEWSFGNGNETPAGVGVVLPFACELFALGLAIEGAGPAEIEARLNDDSAGRSVTITNGVKALNDFSDNTVAYNAGDAVGFRTVIGGANTNGGVVTAWFRYET